MCSSQVCDFVQLFKLGIGKSVHIIMGFNEQSAEDDDKYRSFSIAISEVNEEESVDVLDFRSERNQSHIYIKSFGMINPTDLNNPKYLSSHYLQDILDKHRGLFKFQVVNYQIILIFYMIPYFCLDPVLVKTHK